MSRHLSTLILAGCLAAASHVWADTPQPLETGTDSAFYLSDAVYYPANGEVAVVFVPGFIFNKESWKALATQFQKDGIASLAISAKSENPIRRAMQELARRGHKNLVLVGGSSGAAAILNTMEQVVATPSVVLMSPVRGNPMDDQPVDKLFIASEGEKSFETAKKLYDASAEPKTMIAIPGTAHAQFLFYGPDKAMVTSAIVDFVKAR